MNHYHYDVRQIEKLLVENAQRKKDLRAKNSQKLLVLVIILMCAFFTLYQI